MKFLSILLVTTLTFQLPAQFMKSVSITAGQTFSGERILNSSSLNSRYKTSMLMGFAVNIEPAFFSFGNKKQFDFTTGLSFIQKGAGITSPVYLYDDHNYLTGTGSESYRVRIYYVSVSPAIRFNFAKMFFVKAGPRMDVFTAFNSQARYSADIRTNKDFNSAAFGVTYGAGIAAGKKRVKFIFEFLGQNDLTQSSYNKATLQSYRNFSFLLNFGANISLGKE